MNHLSTLTMLELETRESHALPRATQLGLKQRPPSVKSHAGPPATHPQTWKVSTLLPFCHLFSSHWLSAHLN